MNQLKVFEIRLKIYLLQDIPQEQTYTVCSNFLDSYLAKNEAFLQLHETNCYKQYCFDQPYPVEKAGVYKKDQVYTIRIRTVNAELAGYFSSNLANHYNNQMKGLTLEIRMIPKKIIAQIYSVTPAVIKCQNESESGYWKKRITFQQYEERLKINLIKKYNTITDTKMNEDFDLYHQIELVNRKPIGIPYKGIKLLGDKLCIQAAENEQAQELLYMAIGTGICELNARGCGFVNYRYL